MINRAASMTRFVIGLLLVALMAGCAGSATRESTGEYIDDSSITGSVKAAIYNDPNAQGVELARSVKGVKSVKNSLIVK